MQQLDYDAEMEDQVTQVQGRSQIVGERGLTDSILSMATADLQNPKRHMMPVNEYGPINANKYDFATSSMSHGEGVVVDSYDQAAAEQHRMNRERQFSVPYHPNAYRDIALHNVDASSQMDGSQQSLSDQTRGTMMGQPQQLYGGASQVEGGFPQNIISEIEGDDTEFTEQFDLSLHNISHELDAEVVDDQSAGEELQTVQDDDTQYGGQRSSLKILNHGSVKIKYAADSSRPESQLHEQSVAEDYKSPAADGGAMSLDELN